MVAFSFSVSTSKGTFCDLGCIFELHHGEVYTSDFENTRRDEFLNIEKGKMYIVAYEAHTFCIIKLCYSTLVQSANTY